ncbi:MAG: hypothetical protein ACR2M9_01010 [Cyanophyceae cyanobacterium]
MSGASYRQLVGEHEISAEILSPVDTPKEFVDTTVFITRRIWKKVNLLENRGGEIQENFVRRFDKYLTQRMIDVVNAFLDLMKVVEQIEDFLPPDVKHYYEINNMMLQASIEIAFNKAISESGFFTENLTMVEKFAQKLANQIVPNPKPAGAFLSLQIRQIQTVIKTFREGIVVDHNPSFPSSWLPKALRIVRSMTHELSASEFVYLVNDI